MTGLRRLTPGSRKRRRQTQDVQGRRPREQQTPSLPSPASRPLFLSPASRRTMATAPTKRRISYFYDAEIGNYHYGQGHPMKVRLLPVEALCVFLLPRRVLRGPSFLLSPLLRSLPPCPRPCPTRPCSCTHQRCLCLSSAHHHSFLTCPC